MERERRLSLVVGGFFLLALGSFAVIVLSLSARTGVWSRHYELVAHFGDVIEVRVRVDRHGVKSMTYAFEFWRENTLLAEGKTTSVCCIMHPDRGPEPTEIPDWFTEAVQNGSDGE